MAPNERHVPGSPRYRLQLALSRELRSGERIIWQGQQLGRLRPMLFGIYVFAVPWTAFALFWTAMAATGVATAQQDLGAGLLVWAFPLFGLPFIAVGLGMMAIPFQPLWDRGKVLFAITDQRVLRMRLGRSLRTEACPADRLGFVKRIEHPDGTGSLKIAMNIGRDSDGDKTTEYFEIGDVAQVMAAYEALERLADVGGEAWSGRLEPLSS